MEEEQGEDAKRSEDGGCKLQVKSNVYGVVLRVWVSISARN